MNQRKLCMLLMLVLMLTGCTPVEYPGIGSVVSSTAQSGPQDTLVKFNSAIQRLDVAELLNCFDPAISDSIKALVDIAESVSGIDSETVFRAMPLLYDLAMLSGDKTLAPQRESLRGINLSIVGEVRYSYDNNEAEANVKISSADGQEAMETLFFIKTDGKWYIQIR